MRNYEEEFETLVRSDVSVIEMPSFEWERVHEIVGNAALDLDSRWYTWSAVSGLKVWDPDVCGFQQVDDQSVTIPAALNWLNGQEENSILILEDAHQYLDSNQPNNIRCIREMMREDNFINNNLVKVVVLSCPAKMIPEELSKELPVIEVDLPDRDTIEMIASQTVAKYQDYCLNVNVTPRVLESALGLTVMEARLAFSKAIIQNHQLTEEEIPLIIEEKEQIINKSGLLEYYHPQDHLNSVGGLDNLKDWIKKRGMAYSDNAKEFGLSTPRGVLLLGVPGCGKSLTAKAIANEWQMPLLRFDLGKVFGGLVGESERNIRYALDVAKTVSPCVLWVDEIEKGLSGSQSSGRSDGGTSSRVMGTFLTWLQEKTEPVFVVATANDVSQLPPELLRKGRLDEIFFVDLPSASERKNIFDIHLIKRGRDAELLGLDMDELVSLTKNFSGAEIEEAVNEALFNAYANNQSDLSQQNLVDAIKATTPLAQTMAENIDGLREWSRYRARNASKDEPEEVVTIEEAVSGEQKPRISRYSGMMRHKSDDQNITIAIPEETDQKPDPPENGKEVAA